MRDDVITPGGDARVSACAVDAAKLFLLAALFTLSLFVRPVHAVGHSVTPAQTSGKT